MTYKLYGRAGWGSTIVEAQLAWYGLPFTFEAVEDLFRTPDAAAKLAKVNPLAQVPTLEMPDGVSGLEAKGDLLFCGGIKTPVVRAVKRPARK